MASIHAVGVWGHNDDAEIFGGATLNRQNRTITAASPTKYDQLQAMEAQGLKHTMLWGLVSDEHYIDTFGSMHTRETIYTQEAIAKRVFNALHDLTRYYDLKEVHTHNPWGEYGHIHHRRTSEAVCRAAILLSLDVWSSSSVISIGARTWEQDSVGLPTRQERYENYEQRRQVYYDLEPVMPSRLWTWLDDLDPPVNQTWIQLMGKGLDLRNDQVREMMQRVPVSGLP